MRSIVTVGNGAAVESVAKFSELESAFLAEMFEFMISASELGNGPESSIDAAADVVETIASAA